MPGRIFFTRCALRLGLLLLGGLFVLALPLWGDERADFFETRIRPVLVSRCLECHSAELAENGLRLDSLESMNRGGEGGPAIDLEQPDQSRLLSAIEHRGELQMPPDGKLSDSQIDDFRQWIRAGAVWPTDSGMLAAAQSEMVVTAADREHWAFQPHNTSRLPQLADSARLRTAVDGWIQAKLEQAGLEFSPPAQPRDLLRRIHFDLVGLPPSWEDVVAFEANPTDEAYTAIVDRLLAMPQYGERWGRHWLDVARYSDTKDGVLMYGDDRIRPFAYTYRDYVIRALNADTPYDRFVTEQLAADLIVPPVEKWRLGALGFLTLGRMFDGNPHDCIDDQIDVVTRGLLGLTAACARCHDHKFDPVPTADYYSLYGVFANCESPLELPLIDEAQSEAAQKFEEELRPKRDALNAFISAEHELQSDTARARVGDYLLHVATTPPDPMESAIFFRSLTPEELRVPVIARWRRLLQERLQADDPVFGIWQGYREALAERADKGDRSPGPPWIPFLDSWRNRPRGTAAGMVNPRVFDRLAQTQVDDFPGLVQAYAALLREADAEVSQLMAENSSPSIPPELTQLAELMRGPTSPNWIPRSQTHRYMSRPQADAYHSQVVEIDRLTAQNPFAAARAMVVRETETQHQPHIFRRGNPSQPGRAVARQFLSVLDPENEPFGPGSGRLDLARAITAADNPLAARVIVNRVWMWHFGEPLVATPSDFGRRSPRPVQIDLLDFLASELIRQGWSLKWLHREIVLSTTYRQASLVSAERAAVGQALDPSNQLYWRMNRQRLDVESFRDSLLAVAGKLELSGGGRPELGGTHLEGRRRTVYGLVERQDISGLFRNFDFASPDQSNERRPQTVVPQQALFALNSAFLLTRAEELAELSSTASLSEAERIRWLYRRIFARNPRSEELESCQNFLQSGAPGEPPAWNRLAQTLLASNEFLFVD